MVKVVVVRRRLKPHDWVVHSVTAVPAPVVDDPGALKRFSDRTVENAKQASQELFEEFQNAEWSHSVHELYEQ